MKADVLKQRTKQFAITAIKLVAQLPKNNIPNVLGNQFLRSATSVGANYRSACRARSKADFISKITIVEVEADECCYWLELIGEAGLAGDGNLLWLQKEANELTSIFTAAGKTAKQNGLSSQSKKTLTTNLQSTIPNPQFSNTPQ